LHEEKNPLTAIVASVAAIWGAYVYFLIFAGFGFVGVAQAVVGREGMRLVLGLLGGGGITGCVLAAWLFAKGRGRGQLTAGFAGCLAATMLALFVRSEAVIVGTALLVGLSTAWTAVSLSLCLRPTLHSHRLGMWCGLGTGLAYALCNQPFIFEGALDGKVITGAVAAGIGLLASFRMRSTQLKPSSLPDYKFQAATGWIVTLFALVFLDTLVFFIIQNSATLKQLSWETPLILQGNAFVHLCAAFVTGMVMDQRWPGVSALVALLLLVASCVMLGLNIEHFPKARMLYIAAVSIYSTVLIYLPARGSRPVFTATVYAISGWLATGLALSIAIATDARQVPPFVVLLALLVGSVGLFIRLLSLKRSQEMDSERLIQRKAP
jgi:cytochrome c oxidase cbb3-type subunit 2